MPDISKINALAIGSVSKVDGLAKASILDINGITVTEPSRNPDAASSGFLFTYSGATAAYSVRQLNNNAPYVLRVRRVTGVGNTGNDDEADVKFDTTLTNPTISLDSPVNNFSAGGSNATTLGEFLNVGTVGGTTYSDADSLSPNTAEAYVDTWYDLTGNQNHAEQTAPASQPKIHDGVANTDLIKENGNPAIQTSGGEMLITSSLSVNFQDQSVFCCANSDSSGYGTIVEYSDDAGTGNRAVWVGVNNQSPEKFGSAAYNGQLVFGGNATSQFLGTFIGVNGGSSTVYVDGTQVATATTGTYKSSTGPIQLMRNQEDTLRFPFVGTLQECILYASSQSGNRTGIETDINGFYSIF